VVRGPGAPALQAAVEVCEGEIKCLITGRATIEWMLRHDPEALSLWTAATKGQQGERKDLVYNVHEVPERPSGNARKRALRQLDKAAETDGRAAELRRLVLAGERSPHGALVELGLRRPTIAVPKDVELADDHPAPGCSEAAIAVARPQGRGQAPGGPGPLVSIYLRTGCMSAGAPGSPVLRPAASTPPTR
jgi:hypothetical protein